MNKEGLTIDFRYFYFIRFLLFLFGKKIQHFNQLSENKENRHVSYKTHSNCAIDRSCGFVILFMTILSGRLIERSSHALILLVLWLILTNCYAWILTYSGDKNF